MELKLMEPYIININVIVNKVLIQSDNSTFSIEPSSRMERVLL